MTDPVNLMSVPPLAQCLIAGESLVENSSPAMPFIDSYADAEVCDQDSQQCFIAGAGMIAFFRTANGLSRSAEEARAEGRLEDAVRAYRAAAVKYDKQNNWADAAISRANAYYLDGGIAFRNDCYASASMDFRSAVSEAKRAGAGEFASKIFREAVEMFRGQIEKFIEKGEIDSAFGMTSHMGGLEKGDASLQVKMHEISGRLWELRADALLNKGQDVQVMSSYRVSKFLYEQAGVSGESSRSLFEKMVGILERRISALELSDDNMKEMIGMHVEIAKLYEEYDRWSEAARRYLTIADIYKNKEQPVLAAEMYGEAVRVYRSFHLDVLASGAETLQVHMLITAAGQYMERGKGENSKDLLERAAGIYERIGDMYLEKKHFDGAASAYRSHLIALLSADQAKRTPDNTARLDDFFDRYELDRNKVPTSRQIELILESDALVKRLGTELAKLTREGSPHDERMEETVRALVSLYHGSEVEFPLQSLREGSRLDKLLREVLSDVKLANTFRRGVVLELGRMGRSGAEIIYKGHL